MKTIALLILILLLAGSAQAAQYQVHQLGISPGFDGSEGVGINGGGTVICGAASANDTTGVFTWNHSTGLVDLHQEAVVAYVGINRHGQTVGRARYTDPWLYRPFVRNADGSRTWVPLPPGATDASPTAINDLGQVGMNLYYRDADYNMYRSEAAVIGADGAVLQMDVPSASAEISSLSNTGYVGMNYNQHAYLWDSSSGLRPLVGLTDTDVTRLWDVNDSGVSVGSSGNHAVIWAADGTARDLGLGVACGINNLGQVVGGINNRAVIWDTYGSTVDLGFGEWSCANAINDHGWIVGTVSYPDPYTFEMAVLWEPVPEPSSLLALAGGLISCGLVWRRRH